MKTQFISLKEVQAKTSLCKTSVYNQIKAGKFKPYKIGRKIVFIEDEIDAAILSANNRN